MTVAYLSGPISGMPNENREAFAWATDYLSRSGYIVLNPFDIFTEPAPESPTPQERRAYWRRAMRACIRVLPDADVIVMLPGWGNSSGAGWEHRIATRVFGMPALYLWPDSVRDPLADEEMA